jgi:hypothetical protein
MMNDWEAILDAEAEEANARNAQNAMYGNNNENEEHQQQQHALWLAQQQHAAWAAQVQQLPPIQPVQQAPHPIIPFNNNNENFGAQQHAPLPHIPLHNIPNMGPINVPEGTRNEISMNNIEEGNALVNFRGTDPNSFESKFGYFYKPTTVSHLATHPRTREPIQNYRRRTAHIVPKKNNKPNGSPKARKSRKSRKNRKSRRSSRK